jgi:hypothetical protein
MQREITTHGSLLDARGRLRQPGWARQPLLDANLEVLPGWVSALRLKRWDYYGIWTPDLYVSATVSHVGYVGLVFCYVIDLRSGRQVDHTITRALGRGVTLPRNSDSGDVRYDDGRIRACFALVEGGRQLRVDDPSFDAGRGLHIDAMLGCPPAHESVVMCTPMQGGCFFYNRKINCMPVTGTIRWGDRAEQLAPTAALGQLDWGRGVWPYWTNWIWASANGFLPDGRTIGLNMGNGFGDLSHATENALILNGRVHKLGDLRIELNSHDYHQPWRFTDDEGLAALTFTPAIERLSKANAGILSTEVHQMFGRYDGRVVSDEGEIIALREVPGFAEEQRARW